LKHHHATVMICHSKTNNIEEIVRDRGGDDDRGETLSLQIKGAEIVVACLGKPKFVQGSWLKDHAVVIDCGITSVHGQTFVSRSFLRYSSVHCSGEWQISSVR
jgi:5,10-methylene-tetrahydrofolate dehydrogenase/methenyl tetrahydrofolate cyclohydrolase